MKKKKDQGRNRESLRIFIVLFFFVVGYITIITHLFNLQVIDRAVLAERAKKQQEKKVNVEGDRGSILDRNGNILATNISLWSIYAEPNQIKDKRMVSLKLARILKIDKKEVDNRIDKGKSFVWIARMVDEEKVDQIKKQKIEGIGFKNESKRSYPKGDLLSNIVGFAGLDNEGLEGVELKYNKYLKGEEKDLVMETDALGKTLFPKGLEYITPSNGKNIALTIDEVIQHISERELDKVLEEHSALSGTVIVMNPKTGEILSMAVRPTYDPNIPHNRSPERLRNRAITDLYEPGSTFKIMVSSAALEEKVVNPNEVIFCENGSLNLSGRVVHDVHKAGYLSFSDVIKKSSNIGMIKVGMRLGKDRLHSYIRAFGFGEKTDLGLSGEIQGKVRNVEDWSKLSLASLSIGQEIGVTPIQLITAVSSVANGGYLMKPYIISEIRNSEGNVIEKHVPEVRRRVISSETSKKVIRMLEGVVSDGGSGEKGFIRGYRVAGKTGTAQKLDHATRRYSKDKFISSFVGFFPADDPQIAILVVIDEPKGVYWGGSVAAPVFKNIAEGLIPYLGILPEVEYRLRT